MVMKELKWFGVFIFEILKWTLIGIIELFINLCTILATVIWIIYVINFIYFAISQLINYYIPNHTKTCYVLFKTEYCINN
jgi:hypothetical protein